MTKLTQNPSCEFDPNEDKIKEECGVFGIFGICLLYTSPSPRDRQKSRMPSSA